jgi:RHS repeat-associated protein
MTSRTTGGITAALSYDLLDHLVTWNAGSTSQEWYAYDTSGNRVARRSTTGSGTSITTSVFGLEEHVYDSTGNATSNTSYYRLGDTLIGEATGTATLSNQFSLTDDLGSVVATFSAIAGSAAVLGNQAYGPYGNQLYTKGAMGTAKGYTGQYADTTGLDYYNARYYDPTVGMFLSADTVEGDTQGLDPYSYVQGNPETATDPTGERIDWGSGEQSIVNWSTGSVSTYENNTNWSPQAVNENVQNYIATNNTAYLSKLTSPHATPSDKSNQNRVLSESVTHATYTTITDKSHSTAAKLAQSTGITDAKKVFNNPHATVLDKVKAVANVISKNVNNAMLAASILDPATALGIGGEEEAGSLIGDVIEACGGELSFTAETKVSTNQGKQDIGSLKPGEQVWAYNPKTQKMEFQPIEHVWINHDDDLIDLTLTVPAHEVHGKLVAQTSEVIHTNQKHPFLTQEEGFVPVGELVPGMHIVRADGSVGVVSQWVVVPGVETMYNLEVAQDHTFTVGDGQWVVHNCGPRTPVSYVSARSALKYGATEVTVANRQQAGDLFYELYQRDGMSYQNATGFNKIATEEYFNNPEKWYHWDDQWDPENQGRLLGHDPKTSLDGDQMHLQIHDGTCVIRIFFC